MDVERLRQIKQHILEEPLRVNMARLFYVKNPQLMTQLQRDRADRLPSDHSGWPDCGTIGCLSGWEILLGGHDPYKNGFLGTVARLNLPNHRLLFVHLWPSKFREVICSLRSGTSEYAAVVAEAIEDYIATDGWQTATEKAP